MRVAGVLLADARFPGGGHAHSGGLEPAATAGAVTDLATLEVFLRGRLRTAGLVAAGLAAAACTWAGESRWDELDAEADARTPSPAQREASRRQGRALLRAARIAWPDANWPARSAPHHPVAIGAAAAAAGCAPAGAAVIAAYQSVAGPASAAVRLLALDPMRATSVLARLAADVDDTAARAAACAGGPLSELPCPSAPALDLLAEAHIRAEVRLFES